MSKSAVKDFGAVGDGVTDDSASIQKALAASSHVRVPPGTYACHTMIEIYDGKTLELDGGAVLSRPSSASSDDPVVWMKGSGCAVFGAGQAQSTIRSERRAPRGVVRLGHKDMTETHGNVLHNTLRDLRISGAKDGGQSTGAPDAALYMANPQFKSISSGLHNVTGLLVEQANFGIWLQGAADANSFSNIHGARLGNILSGYRAFIFDNGTTQNSFSNCFLHISPASIGLLIAPYDNRSVPGGWLHKNYGSSYKGLIFELIGVDARGLVSRFSEGSFFEIRHNAEGRNEVEDGFYDRNHFLGLDSRPYDKIYREGNFSHNAPVAILKRTFRSALVTVTYEGDDNGNYTRSDLLLLSTRAEDFSGSNVEVVKTSQSQTGTKGEIVKVTYKLMAPGATLDATLTATVERANGKGGRFKVSGFQTA